MGKKTQTRSRLCQAAQRAPHLLPTGSTTAPAEPVHHCPLRLLLPQEEPPLHSHYMGPWKCCYTNLCSMIAISLPGASACVGMNKEEKLQCSPSPTFLTCSDLVSETPQLSLWPQLCQRQERALLLNHSKTNVTTCPFLHPVCPFQIPILSIIPYSIHLPRQCLIQLQSQLCDTPRDIILLKAVEQMQIKRSSENLKPPNRKDCLWVTPGK